MSTQNIYGSTRQTMTHLLWSVTVVMHLSFTFKPYERKNAVIISWLNTNSSVCTDTRRFWLHCNCVMLSRLAQQYT